MARVNPGLLAELCGLSVEKVTQILNKTGTPADMAETVSQAETAQDVSKRNPPMRSRNDSPNLSSAEIPQCATQQEAETDIRPCSEGASEITPSLEYVRRHGESLKAYMQRTRTDLFLANSEVVKIFLREGVKPEDFTREQEQAIVAETRKGYQLMWEGEKAYRNGRYFSQEKANRVLQALDGALKKNDRG